MDHSQGGPGAAEGDARASAQPGAALQVPAAGDGAGHLGEQGQTGAAGARHRGGEEGEGAPRRAGGPRSESAVQHGEHLTGADLRQGHQRRQVCHPGQWQRQQWKRQRQWRQHLLPSQVLHLAGSRVKGEPGLWQQRQHGRQITRQQSHRPAQRHRQIGEEAATHCQTTHLCQGN